MKVAAMILAGGKSSRMGRDKAKIEIDGIPMLRRIYDVVAGCNAGEIKSIDGIYIVTPWIERYQSILPMQYGSVSQRLKSRLVKQSPPSRTNISKDISLTEPYCLPMLVPFAKRLPQQSGCANDCNFIAEELVHRGPLVGFARGLSQIEADWVLLLACDLPNLSTSFIQGSIDRLSDIPTQSIAYLPKSDRGWEALCGFYRGNCLDSLRAYINGGGQSFQGWLKGEKVTELAVEDPRILLNCNTPADLAEIIDLPIPTPARSKIE